LFDLLEARKADAESQLRKVKGFAGYTLMRTADGGISLTVCETKAGTDESLAVAREWIKKNASEIKADPPTVAEGGVILHLK